MMELAQNEAELRSLARMLCRLPLTAAQIAEQMKCSKMAAYKRIRALRRRGLSFKTAKVRGGDRGPKARAYQLEPSRALKKMLARS